MSPKQKEFLFRWLNTTVGVVVATYLVRGIHYRGVPDLLIASLFLGILNAFVRPLLMFLSLPLMILTLGLFTFVINGLLLYLVGGILQPYFEVTSFRAAFWGALVITITAFFLNLLIGTGRTRIQVRRTPPPPPKSNDDSGGGPIIDI